jgi:hypothetical protein
MEPCKECGRIDEPMCVCGHKQCDHSTPLINYVSAPYMGSCHIWPKEKMTEKSFKVRTLDGEFKTRHIVDFEGCGCVGFKADNIKTK